MGKLMDFFEQKSHYLMAIFIILQGALFTLFTILFFIENLTTEIRYKIYIFGCMFIFFCFMVYFAYHSIKRAYFIELIAFLLMSTCSSIIFILNFYHYVIDKTDLTSYRVIGIISIILLSIGNIVYFVSAYYSYIYFELKFFERLGAKVKLHEIFKWIQFNMAMLKTDFGLILVFLMSTYIFNYDHILYVILDTISGIVLFTNIFLMRKSLRNELKVRAILIAVFRILLEAYKLYRIYYFIFEFDLKETSGELYRQYKGGVWIMVGVSVIDEIVLVLIVISTFMCIRNFGQGLKEMLVKQNEAVNSITQLSELA